MVHGEDRQILHKKILESAETLERFEWKGKIDTGSLTVKTILARSIPNKKPDGTIVWDGIVIDMTDVVKLQSQLEAEKKKLFHTAKLASIGELAAGIGHEINNPLSIALGNVGRVRRYLANEQDINPKHLESIDASLQRIAKIVYGLKTYARIDESQPRNLDFNEACQKTLSLITELYTKNEVQLEVDFNAEHPTVLANEGEIQQILTNLVTNAKDAVQDCENPSIKVSSRNEGNFVLLEVKDNGTGICPLVAGKIFESFFTTKPVGQGTGMGLGITKELVTKMNGEISFETNVGEGTSFLVKIPLAQISTEDVVEVKSKAPSLPQLQGHVLIIDDEPEIREILKEDLNVLGMTVEVASSGPKALEILEQENFDYIITDFRMLEMNGGEFTEIARSRTPQHTKFFVVTGGLALFKDGSAASRYSHFFEGVIPKPFTPEKIYEIMDEALNPKLKTG